MQLEELVISFQVVPSLVLQLEELVLSFQVVPSSHTQLGIPGS